MQNLEPFSTKPSHAYIVDSETLAIVDFGSTVTNEFGLFDTAIYIAQNFNANLKRIGDIRRFSVVACDAANVPHVLYKA